MCPYTSPGAIEFWSKACNICRSVNYPKCDNSTPCNRNLYKAKVAEECYRLFVEEWQ